MGDLKPSALTSDSLHLQDGEVAIVVTVLLIILRMQLHQEIKGPVNAQHVDLVLKALGDLTLSGQYHAVLIQLLTVHLRLRGLIVKGKDGVLLLQ